MTKAQIYNLTLGLLLLNRRVTNPDTESGTEVRVLNTHWETALEMALADMDLDSTASQVTLELLEDMTDDTDPARLWNYAYYYPDNCAILRRLRSKVVTDNRYSHIPKQVQIYMGEKCILTNEAEAVADYITKDFDVLVNTLNSATGMAIACKLAEMAAPLITGKGAKKLVDDVRMKYAGYKAQAQRFDQQENFNFNEPETESEFVAERTS